MYTGHQKDAWIHTTNIIATMINVNRGEKSEPCRFEDIYPFRIASNDDADDKDDIEVIKAAWLAGAAQSGTDRG